MSLDTFLTGAQAGAPASRVDNVHFDNSGERALQKANAELGQTVLGLGQGLLDRRIETDVMAANGEYNARMDALAVKLMSNKEGAAQNNVQLFEDGRKKVVEEVLKKFKYAGNGAGKRAFLISTDKDWAGQRRRMAVYQAGELEKYQNSTLAQQKSLMLGQVASQFQDDDVLSEMIDRGDVMVASRYKDYGPERVGQEQQLFRTEVVMAALQAALAEKNWLRANDLLDLGQGILPEAEAKDLKESIYERKFSAVAGAATNALYQRFNGNYQGALEVFQKEFASKDPAKASKQLAIFNNQWEDLRRLFRQQSDKNYIETKNVFATMQESGKTYAEMLAWVQSEAGGDQRKEQALMQDLQQFRAKNGPGISDREYYNCIKAVAEGRVRDLKQFNELMTILGVTAGQRKELEGEYANILEGKGAYKVNWADIKTQVMSDEDVYKKMGKTTLERNAAWSDIEFAGQQFVREYLAGNNDKGTVGKIPDRYQIINYCKTALDPVTIGVEKGMVFDSDIKVSNAEMYRANMRRIVNLGDGNYRVYWLDRSYEPTEMNSKELLQLVKGEEQDDRI